MRPTGQRNQWARLTGWMLSILVLGLLSPSEAWATCGEYHKMPIRSHHVVKVGIIELPGMVDADANPLPLPKPCNGPHCSSMPTAPIVPTTPTVRLLDQEWGWLNELIAPQSPDGSHLLEHEQNLDPVCLCLSIFHPPRSNS